MGRGGTPGRDTIRPKIPTETGPRRFRAVNAPFGLQHRAAPDIGQIEFLPRSSTGLVHIPDSAGEWEARGGTSDETVLQGRRNRPETVVGYQAHVVKKGASL